jgi:hypothetical protein
MLKVAMSIRRVLPVVILAMVGWPANAVAQAPGSLDVSFGYYINEDGTGGLDATVSGAPIGQAPSVNWEACPPAAACTPIAPRQGSSPSVLTGTGTPGTVFVVTASNGSQTAKATSLPWLGLVRAVTAPAIQGNLHVGGLVTPVPGVWSGGWGNDTSLLQLQICRTATGAGCVVIADSYYWSKCPGTGAVLTYDFVGQYVRIVEKRIGRSTPFPAFGVGSPGGLHPIEPGPTGAAAVAGPIAAAPWKPESTCGLPPPRVTLLKRAKLRGKRLEIGQVGCLQQCQVGVKFETCKLMAGGCRALRPGEKKVSVYFTRTFPGGPQSGKLFIPSRQTRRIGPGSYSANVFQAGAFGVSAQVKVPRSAAEAKSKR